MCHGVIGYQQKTEDVANSDGKRENNHGINK